MLRVYLECLLFCVTRTFVRLPVITTFSVSQLLVFDCVLPGPSGPSQPSLLNIGDGDNGGDEGDNREPWNAKWRLPGGVRVSPCKAIYIEK